MPGTVPPVSERVLDAVVIGGGHNGLVAAAYLAGAGRSVRVLERTGVLGGAARSDAGVPGPAGPAVEVRLPRQPAAGS